ncbi:MAG: alpha/beta hydrolase [Rhizomicrobium sp.]
MVFLDYDQAGLDRQYDQRAWAPNAVEVIRGYTENSAQVRARLGEPDVFAYGQSAAETLDLYRCPNDNAPIHVFIHGGAWRQLGKRDSAFAAETFVRAGAHFIALDFALLPSVTLAEMVAQVRRSVAWIHQNAARFGGDPARLHISGHSSGGHLAGCAAVTDWQEFGLPSDVVKSAVLASGIYDLLPVRLSARNDYVRLDASTEQALSPIRHLQRFTGKAYVACGALESDEFKRQARALAAALDPRQLAAPLAEYAGLNHFEVAHTLADPHGGLGRAALGMMGLSPG